MAENNGKRGGFAADPERAREAGRKGAQVMKEKFGIEHFRQIGKRGGPPFGTSTAPNTTAASASRAANPGGERLNLPSQIRFFCGAPYPKNQLAFGASGAQRIDTTIRLAGISKRLPRWLHRSRWEAERWQIHPYYPHNRAEGFHRFRKAANNPFAPAWYLLHPAGAAYLHRHARHTQAHTQPRRGNGKSGNILP